VASLRRALALAPGNPRIDANLGWALMENDRPAEAEACFARAAAAQPDLADRWDGLAASRLRTGRAAEALAATDRALAAAPGHIRSLALRAIALDALGRTDERRGVVDLDRMMWSRRHRAPPPGHADLAAFNGALRRHVLAHPTLMRDRPDKTTRNGRQTDDLLTGDPGPMAGLAGLFRDAVESFRREALPAEGPYSAAHWPARWTLRAWATVLDASGHQDPHHHPFGFVSGVYYVRVPPGVGRAPGDHAGWIEFGRPDPFFGDASAPEVRLFQPEEGLMLLFPSHFWHRTIPFVDTEPRISIAFDMVPAA
jgi:tetratricopeptide (TPR) repeat protein